MAGQIQRRGVAFVVTSAVLDALQRKGAGPQTLAAIQALAPVNGTPIPGSLGGRVREVTVIKSAIRDSGQIEGEFTQEEVMDLSKLLSTGALPASLDFLDDRNVCPSRSLGPTG